MCAPPPPPPLPAGGVLPSPKATDPGDLAQPGWSDQPNRKMAKPAGGMNAGLLADLNKKKTMKKTVTNDRSAPMTTRPPANSGGGAPMMSAAPNAGVPSGGAQVGSNALFAGSGGKIPALRKAGGSAPSSQPRASAPTLVTHTQTFKSKPLKSQQRPVAAPAPAPPPVSHAQTFKSKTFTSQQHTVAAPAPAPAPPPVSHAQTLKSKTFTSQQHTVAAPPPPHLVAAASSSTKQWTKPAEPQRQWNTKPSASAATPGPKAVSSSTTKKWATVDTRSNFKVSATPVSGSNKWSAPSSAAPAKKWSAPSSATFVTTTAPASRQTNLQASKWGDANTRVPSTTTTNYSRCAPKKKYGGVSSCRPGVVQQKLW